MMPRVSFEALAAGLGEAHGAAGWRGLDPALGEQPVGDRGAKGAGEMVLLL